MRLVDHMMVKPLGLAAWIMAMLKFVWGLWLVLPFNTFASAPTFDAMATLAPEIVWGAGMIAIALSFIFFVIRDNVNAVRWVSLIGSIAWYAIFLSYAAANWRSTAIPSYFSIAIMETAITAYIPQWRD